MKGEGWARDSIQNSNQRIQGSWATSPQGDGNGKFLALALFFSASQKAASLLQPGHVLLWPVQCHSWKRWAGDAETHGLSGQNICVLCSGHFPSPPKELWHCPCVERRCPEQISQTPGEDTGLAAPQNSQPKCDRALPISQPRQQGQSPFQQGFPQIWV